MRRVAYLCLIFPASLFSTMVTTDLNTLTPANLVSNLVGAGIPFSSVSYTGSNVAAGIFSGAAAAIGFDSGIVLSSGSIQSLPGPNISDGTSTSFALPGDTDLTIIAGTPTNDAAILEFDFVPSGFSLSFQYVFGSEEYHSYVGSINDSFALWVNGVNYALIPGSGQAVTINTVNIFSNSTFFVNNALVSNPPAALVPLDIELDGLTVVLTLNAPVNPGVTNHIKIGIADAADTDLDSAVLIRAGSFIDYSPTRTSTVSPTPTPLGTATATPTISPTQTITQTYTVSPTPRSLSDLGFKRRTCDSLIPS